MADAKEDKGPTAGELAAATEKQERKQNSVVRRFFRAFMPKPSPQA